MFNIDFIIGCNADELKEVVQLVEYAQAIDLPLSSSRLLLTMDGIQFSLKPLVGSLQASLMLMEIL